MRLRTNTVQIEREGVGQYEATVYDKDTQQTYTFEIKSVYINGVHTVADSSTKFTTLNMTVEVDDTTIRITNNE